MSVTCRFWGQAQCLYPKVLCRVMEISEHIIAKHQNKSMTVAMHIYLQFVLIRKLENFYLLSLIHLLFKKNPEQGHAWAKITEFDH